MKRFILAMLILFSIGSLQKIEAKGVIVYGLGETISKVQDLPEECTMGDEHVNLGVMYEQFSLFWMPIWNYGDVQYVLFNDKEDTYWDLDEEMIEILKSDFGAQMDEEASVPFWTKIGGKPIIILLILFFFFRSRFSKS